MRFLSCLLFGLIASLAASISVAQTTESTLSSSATRDHCWQELRVDVYEWLCAAEALDGSAQNFALRPILIAARGGLLLTEPGATGLVGKRLATDIQLRFGLKPLWILNAQPKPEHVLGSGGLSDYQRRTGHSGAVSERIVSGAITARLMAQRCTSCIENFSQVMSPESLKGTEALIPKRILQGSSGSLSVLGPEWSGWRYQFHKSLMTEEAMVLTSKDHRVKWFGGLVLNQAIPDLYQGQINRRVDFLARNLATVPEQWMLVGSSGRFDRKAIEHDLEYFLALQMAVIQAQASGVTEVELINVSTSELTSKYPDLPSKLLETHQLNVQRVWRQMEDLNFQ